MQPELTGQLLTSLERAERPKLLLPVVWRSVPQSVWPISPTDVLRRYAKRCPARLLEEIPVMPDGSIFLEPWGWCEIGEPQVLRAESEFRTSAGVAGAIACADPWIKPVRIGVETMLTAVLKPGVAFLLMSCSWWLISRNNAFIAMLQQIAAQEAEAVRLPVISVPTLLAPPGESIH